MKWFWIVIAVLVIAAAALAIRSRSASSTGGASVPSTTPRTEAKQGEVAQAPAAKTTPHAAEGDAVANGADKVAPTPDVNSATQQQAKTTAADTVPASATTPATPNDQPQGKSVPSSPSPAPTVPTAAKDGTPKPDAATGAQETKSPKPSSERAAEEAAAARALADALDKALAGEEISHIPPVQALPTAPLAQGGGTASSSTASASKPPPAATTSPADSKPTLVTQPDGTVLVDGQYVIAGKGTQAEPYKIPWEMLVSAEKTYQPRLGRKEIPGRLTMLHDTWVTISGYIAFPLMAQSQDEMLMMLNQWDGCCIGVPPTPYDAIEVKLKTAAKGDDRLKVTGSVTGKLKVDPYLVKDWLVSLYLMDDAELVTTGKAGAAPAKH